MSSTRAQLSLLSAGLLFAIFAVQVGLAFHFRNDEAATIQSLTILVWIYLALATVLMAPNARQLVTSVCDGLLRSHVRLEAAHEAQHPR